MVVRMVTANGGFVEISNIIVMRGELFLSMGQHHLKEYSPLCHVANHIALQCQVDPIAVVQKTQISTPNHRQ